MKGLAFLERRHGSPVLGATLVATIVWFSPEAPAVGAPPKFGDEKTTWHGFDRYDFLMDEADLSIKPAAHHEKSVNQMLDQVIAWSGALKPLRVAVK